MKQSTDAIYDYLDGEPSAGDEFDLAQWVGVDRQRIQLLVETSLLHVQIQEVVRENDVESCLNVENINELINLDISKKCSTKQSGNKASAKLSSVQRKTKGLQVERIARRRIRRDGKIFQLGGLGVYRTNQELAIEPGRRFKIIILALIASGLLWFVFQKTLSPEKTLSPGVEVVNSSPAPVAQLISVLQDTWLQSNDAASPPPQSGHLLFPGLFELATGFARIKMQDGADILLKGPCSFELIDENQLKILSGSLTASVPQSAHGFTVQTPTGRIVDLGTEFGVKVNAAGATVAAVFEGEVTLESQRAGSISEPIPISSGKQGKVDLFGLSIAVQDVDPRINFVRTFEEAFYQPTINGNAAWRGSIDVNLLFADSSETGSLVKEITRGEKNRAHRYARVRLVQAGIRLRKPIYSVFMDSGMYDNQKGSPKGQLLNAGQILDCYCVIMPGGPAQDAGIDFAEFAAGELLFPRKIIGLIANPKSIMELHNQLDAWPNDNLKNYKDNLALEFDTDEHKRDFLLLNLEKNKVAFSLATSNRPDLFWVLTEPFVDNSALMNY